MVTLRLVLVLIGCTGAPSVPGAEDQSGADSGAGRPDTGPTTGDSGGDGGSSDGDGDGFDSPDDCDDTDATVFPGAAERCGDGVDQDCDGQELGCSGEMSARDAAGWLSSDASLGIGAFGAATAVVDGWTTDGSSLIVTSAYSSYPEDGDPIEDIGHGALFGLRPDRLQGSTGDGVATRTEWRVDGIEPSQALGLSISRLDLDGDDIDDLIVGAPGGWPDPAPDGGVWLLHGPLAESGDIAESGGTWVPGSSAVQAGWRTLAARDATGDGHADPIVAGSTACRQGALEGAWVLDGATVGSGTIEHQGTEFAFELECIMRDGFGLEAADLDGDGIDDLVLGAAAGGSSIAFEEDGSVTWLEQGPGFAAVFLGPLTEARTTLDADTRLIGTQAGGRLGAQVAAGDLDGDGSTDLVTFAPYRDATYPTEGVAWLVDQPTSPGEHLVSDVAVGKVHGGRTEALMNGNVDLAGDLDGDSLPEVLLSRWRSADDQTGEVMVFQSPVAGTLTPDDARLQIRGAGDGSQLGMHWGRRVLSGRDDLDGDGLSDLLLFADDSDTSTGGTLTLLYGGVWPD